MKRFHSVLAGGKADGLGCDLKKISGAAVIYQPIRLPEVHRKATAIFAMARQMVGGLRRYVIDLTGYGATLARKI